MKKGSERRDKKKMPCMLSIAVVRERGLHAVNAHVVIITDINSDETD